MEKKILDASVIVKWFSEEPESKKALKYLQGFVKGKFSLVLPTLLFYELGNVFWKKGIPVKEISDIIQKIHKLVGPQLLVEDVGFNSFRKVYQTAKEYNITFYDAAYIVLMQKYDCEFTTTDKKLFNKLYPVFSKIKLL